MTPAEFWHGSPGLATAYRKAYRIKQANQYLKEWREGVYVREALLAASPAFREISKGINHEYPKQPIFVVDERESRERENKARMEQQKAQFEAMARALNEKFAAKGKAASE